MNGQDPVAVSFGQTARRPSGGLSMTCRFDATGSRGRRARSRGLLAGRLTGRRADSRRGLRPQARDRRKQRIRRLDRGLASCCDERRRKETEDQQHRDRDKDRAADGRYCDRPDGESSIAEPLPGGRDRCRDPPRGCRVGGECWNVGGERRDWKLDDGHGRYWSPGVNPPALCHQCRAPVRVRHDSLSSPRSAGWALVEPRCEATRGGPGSEGSRCCVRDPGELDPRRTRWRELPDRPAGSLGFARSLTT
jgi:hypothetical protein